MISSSRALTSSLMAALVLQVATNLNPTAAQDVVIHPGDTVVIDTQSQVLKTTTGELLHMANGILVLDNFEVGEGATLNLRGPNPFRLSARGEIRIYGHIDASGGDAKNVTGVFTATFPEPGGYGNLSGGKGGDASIMITASTVAGCQGVDAFGQLVGGGGGESGYGADASAVSGSQIQNSNPNSRRGAGGGGGTFGPDVSSSLPAGFSTIGVVAQPGFAGSSMANGALGNPFPMGGTIGQSPFQDGDRNNDFWGVGFDRRLGKLVHGELRQLTGGAGGGGGGDSVRSLTFPNPNFSNKTEDKGAAGGGGGGALHLRAMGRITLFNELIGAQGSITANGGNGGRGQLVQYQNNFFVKSGSGGGGGSGGHIVIESETSIDLGMSLEVLQARGGLGGSYSQPNDIGRGGDGGPGVIQLHAPSGQLSITSALPFNEVAVPAPKILLPRLGLR